MNPEINKWLRQVAQKCQKKNLTLSTAESCTGGGIAAALTELSGSSNWFEGGIVSYSNDSKYRLLGVSPQLIEHFGAVSGEVVEAMVTGVLEKIASSAAVAVSGVAGPGGGSEEKPVGTVWIAWKMGSDNALVKQFLFSGDRAEVREQTVLEALKGFVALL